MTFFQGIFPYLIEMSLLASLIFTLVYVLRFRKGLVNSASYSWVYGELKLVLLLWMFPFISFMSWFYSAFPKLFLPFILIFPVKPAETVTLPPLFPSEMGVPPTVSQTPTNVMPSTPFDIIEAPTLVSGESLELLTFPSFLPLIWGIFCGILTIRIMFQWYRWRKLLKRAHTVDQKIQHLFEKECVSFQIKEKISLLSWDILDTPVLVGLFHKKIVLPEKKGVDYPYRQVFSHELSHAKGKDIWWNVLLQFAVVVHFFNPLVYLFAQKFREVMEFACDERVGKHLDFHEKKLYCKALLESVSLRQEEVTIYGLGFSNSKMNIERRMIAMINPKNMSKFAKITGVLLVSTLLLGTTVPSAIESGKNAQIATVAEQALLDVEGLTEVEVVIHKNGRVFITYHDTSENTYEEQIQKENTIQKLISEVCDVDILDVWWFYEEYPVKVANKELDEKIADMTTVNSRSIYSYSPKDWATILEGVDSGRIELLESSPEEMEFFEMYASWENTPAASSTIAPNGYHHTMPYDMKTKIYQAYNDYGTGVMNVWVVPVPPDGEDYFFEVSFYHAESGEYLVSVDGGDTWTVEDETAYTAYQDKRHNEFMGEVPELSQEELDFNAFVETLEHPPTSFTTSFPQEKYNDINLLMSGSVEFPSLSYEITKNLYQSYNDFGTGDPTAEWVEVNSDSGEGYFILEMTQRDTGKQIFSEDGGISWHN